MMFPRTSEEMCLSVETTKTTLSFALNVRPQLILVVSTPAAGNHQWLWNASVSVSVSVLFL